MSILFYEHQDFTGTWAEVILDRPEAMNAVDDYMSQRLYFALESWLNKEHVKYIVIRSSSKNFCAGADLDTLLSQVKVDSGAGNDYILRQYKIINMVRFAQKPIWVMASGATVGFGAGLFMAASNRVCDPSFYLAMPECSIGFFPDVGACKFMLDFPNFAGVLCGGMTIRVGDLLAASKLDAVILYEDFDLWLSNMEPKFVDCFSEPKVFRRSWSPMSVAYASMLIEHAHALNYREFTALEYTLARIIVQEPDFLEGLKAFQQKRTPCWQKAVKIECC